MRAVLLMLILAGVLVGCQGRGQDISDLPTRVPSLDDLATSEFMTANAPPEGFREEVSFNLIDENLVFLPSWHYEVFLSFEGVYSGTSRPVTAQTTAEVWFNETGPERRVVVEGTGELLGAEEGVTIEGVRLGGDAFLLRDNTCLGAADGAAAVVADLEAGSLVGGVVDATPNGINQRINAEQVWQYEFGLEDLRLPQIDFGETGRVIAMRGELWVAPEHEAVIRYYLTLDIENALIRLDTSETPLPVTGQINIRYDLYEIGVNPNITQPFGC